MITYNIPANGSINLSPKKSFYGANSLLNIKLTRMPEIHRGQDLYFKAVYRNNSGATLSCPITLFSPYYFNAITPDFSDIPDNFPREFSSVELSSSNNFEVVILASLNTNLHSNLDSFHKMPAVQVTYNGKIYNAEIEETSRDNREMGNEIFYDMFIQENTKKIVVAKISEYPEGEFTVYEQNPNANFSQQQMRRFLSE